MRPVRGAARAMLSAIFVIDGARAVIKPDAFVPRAEPLVKRVTPVLEKTNLPIPTDTASLVRITGATQLVAGLMLSTGHFTRLAALALAGTLVPTTVAGHPFWTVDDPTQRANYRMQFTKNLGLFGGLLLAAVDTEGRPGLRWRTSHAVNDGRRSIQRAVEAAGRDARRVVRSAPPVRGLRR